MNLMKNDTLIHPTVQITLESLWLGMTPIWAPQRPNTVLGISVRVQNNLACSSHNGTVGTATA